MIRNNETIGISAEIAIAKSFGVPVTHSYEVRSDSQIVDFLMSNDNIKSIFKSENIPTPIKHIAEGQNPVDFILEGQKTLSVKTNQEKLGKVAPQIIGQPTAETYFSYLEKYFDGFSLCKILEERNLFDTYDNRALLFKEISMKYVAKIVNMYWENMFDCDYYLHLFNVEKFENPLDNFVVLGKKQPPVWENKDFTFTQSLDSWNESNTLKYHGISIGEFQVHKNRNCFKFRFNMKGIMQLFNDNLT